MFIQTDVFARASTIGPALWRNRLLIALVSLHFAGVYLACLIVEEPFRSGTASTLINLLQVQVPVFLAILLFWRFGWMAVHVRPAQPATWFANDLKTILCDSYRILTGVFAFLAMCLFAGSFTIGKDLIPLINPFSWDPVFASIDRALHFGHDPWTLLFFVTGTPFITTILNAVYHLWLPLSYFLVFVACFNISHHDKHLTYLVADVACWVIGGNILATIFSSVGPVYYQAFGYGDAFAPLMEKLYTFDRTSPVWALSLQEMLIAGYANDGPVKGISAMPSMHVASAVTMTLYAFSVSRRLGWGMTIFATMILLGSVQLGWHYAIDGYASILLSLACWCLARRLVRLFAA